MIIRFLTFSSLFFIAGISILFPLGVFSEEVGGNNEEIQELNQEIQKKQDKIKQIEQTIEEYKKRISQKQTEAVSLSNQISLLDNKTAQVELDISATQEKLSILTLEIKELELVIEDKETSIEKQKKILAEFLRTLYQQEGKDVVEIMAAYDNFSDFYDQVRFLQRLESEVKGSVTSLRIAKLEIEDKKVQTEARKQTYDELYKELEEKRKDLNEQSFAKSNLLLTTKSSELQYKTLVSSLRGQYQQIENEIAGIEKEVRKRLDAQEKLSQSFDDNQSLLSWPTASRYITARFHDPSYPYRNVFEHNAIDIRASHGTPVQAAASGYVARAKHCTVSSCYAFVMIIHSGGISTVYGHLSNISVKEDQFVARGDIIGLSGGTPGTVGAGPFVTGPHLHFEVRKDGIPVNPLSYLVKDY